MQANQKKIFVIGHRNPDTDSICSAIAYADFKMRTTGNPCYVASRAGELNAETKFVLDYFKMDEPVYIGDVRTQVRDIEIRDTKGVQGTISMKNAYALMKENNLVTLPIVEEEKLEGLITIFDIATSYMDVYDSRILSKAQTPYKNVIETLDAELLVGDENAIFSEGKVLIAAANPDLMESYIEPHDIVILGNRYESQLCAIEMEAGCIVVCEGAQVSRTIRHLAQERGCTVLSTPHDTYTAARLINQSIPVQHFMITKNILSFRTGDYVDNIKGTMMKMRTRDFPVLDHKGRYRGIISRRSLLDMRRKQIILVDHNERSQAVEGIEDADILEIIDHHRLGTIETITPVYFRNQPLGCTATIITQMYREAGQEIPAAIAGLLCAAILSDTLMYRSPTCTEVDRRTAEELASIAGIDVKTFADEMFRAGSNMTSMSAESILFHDFKKFQTDDINFGVGQVTSLNNDDLETVKAKLLPYLEQAVKSNGLDMIFFMLTNIITESTDLLYFGDGAKELVESAFNVKEENKSCMLQGVVSRKKQLIPELMGTLQQ